MTQTQTSHEQWQHAIAHNPILDNPSNDVYCPARLADSVETYLITVNGDVYVRLAMGACKLLSYYCDDNNSGSLAMSAQFADYRTAFNGWIKNVALSVPMGHAVFNEGIEGEVTYSNGKHGYYTCECTPMHTCELHGDTNDWYDKRSNKGML